MFRSRLSAVVSTFVIGVFTVAMLVPVQYLPFEGRHDKLQHAIFAAIIMIVLVISLRLSILKIGILVSVLAVLSELVQDYIPYRSGNLDDLIADLIGVVVSAVIIAIVQFIYREINLRFT